MEFKVGDRVVVNGYGGVFGAKDGYKGTVKQVGSDTCSIHFDETICGWGDAKLEIPKNQGLYIPFECLTLIEKEEGKLKYKVGDKVRVRSDLKAWERHGADCFTEAMGAMLGKTVTIAEVRDKKYGIKEFGYNWIDEMFEGLAEPVPIKAYDLMKLAAENPKEYEGKRYKVVDGYACGNMGESTKEIRINSGEFDAKNIAGNVYVSRYTELEEIKPEPKPVPFMEAVKAYSEGKTIRVKWNDRNIMYEPKRNSLDNPWLKDNRDSTITASEILHGKWYIID